MMTATTAQCSHPAPCNDGPSKRRGEAWRWRQRQHRTGHAIRLPKSIVPCESSGGLDVSENAARCSKVSRAGAARALAAARQTSIVEETEENARNKYFG